MKKTYHIHIYKVLSKAEINIKAISPLVARRKALEKRGKLKFGKSDCGYLALDFLVKNA